jgi:hypothetical protein
MIQPCVACINSFDKRKPSDFLPMGSRLWMRTVASTREELLITLYFPILHGGEMKPQRKLSRQSANHEITR